MLALELNTGGTNEGMAAAPLLNRLEKYEPAFDELGVSGVAELADVTDEEMKTMGLSLVQIK